MGAFRDEPEARRFIEEFETAGQAPLVEVSSVGELHGQCDAGLLSQVISNLLCNALTHGEAGTPVQLSIDGRAADSIELRIANRGVIPAALLPTLFEPFQQAGEKRRTGQGLGLGLYTVNMFVKAHGGTVEISTGAAFSTGRYRSTTLRSTLCTSRPRAIPITYAF